MGRTACKSALHLCDLLKKNSPDPACAFFVQAKMRAFFNYSKGVSKFRQKSRIAVGVHLA